MTPEENTGLNTLASQGGAEVGSAGAGAGGPTPPPTQQDFGPQPSAPGGRTEAKNEQQVQQEVGQALQEVMSLGGQIAQVDPRLTPIIKGTLEKLYLQIADFYGMGEDAKLALKKGRSQMQAQGMNQMGQV